MSSNKKTAKKEIKKVEKKSKLPIIIGLAILLGVVGFGALYLLSNPETGSNGSDDETESAEIAPGNPETPTEAYKKLYEAVSSKNREGIRAMMSTNSMGLAEMQAGQSKKELDEVLKNGFFTANMSDTLPNIRDERIKGKYAAIEVYSKNKSRWENIPFVVEDGAWKLAAGDMFSGKFKSPGKSRTIKENEIANASGQRDMVPYGNGNVNMNVKPKIIDPMKDGKMVPPPNLPKKEVNPTEKDKK